VEGDLLGVGVYSQRIISSRRMKEKDMYRRHRRHDKRDHKMESEKPGQGGVIHREPSSEPQNQVRTEVWESGEEIGDHRRAPEPYLPSRENIPQKGSRYYQDQ